MKGGGGGVRVAFPSVSSVLKDVGNRELIFMKFVFEWRRKRVVKERSSWRSVPRRLGERGPEPLRLSRVF